MARLKRGLDAPESCGIQTRLMDNSGFLYTEKRAMRRTLATKQRTRDWIPES